MAILDAGKIIKAQKTHQLREDVRRLIRIFPGAGVVNWNGTPDVLDVTVDGGSAGGDGGKLSAGQRADCRAAGGSLVREVPLNLDEIFEAYVIGNRGKRI